MGAEWKYWSDRSTTEQDTVLLSPLDVIWDSILGVTSLSIEIARHPTHVVASFLCTAPCKLLTEVLYRPTHDETGNDRRT